MMKLVEKGQTLQLTWLSEEKNRQRLNRLNTPTAVVYSMAKKTLCS
jgi:hypothetical protein